MEAVGATAQKDFSSFVLISGRRGNPLPSLWRSVPHGGGRIRLHFPLNTTSLRGGLRPTWQSAPLIMALCAAWGRTDSLACGRATAVASVPRTLAKSRLSNPSSKCPYAEKVQHQKVLDFFWWGRTDSNHRSDTQQIYSLSPLATRELPHI